jgi:hypothetical protein
MTLAENERHVPCLNSQTRYVRRKIALVPAAGAALCLPQLLNRMMGNFHGLLLMPTEIVIGLPHVPLSRFEGADSFMNGRTAMREWDGKGGGRWRCESYRFCRRVRLQVSDQHP